MRRIKDHERHYEPVDEPEHPWIRVINVGEKIQVNVCFRLLVLPSSHSFTENPRLSPGLLNLASNFVSMTEVSTVPYRLLPHERSQSPSIHILRPGALYRIQRLLTF